MWYIMAAGSWMRKPSVEKIISEHAYQGVITVAKIDDKAVFILGAGDSVYGEVESKQEFIYDTGNGHRKPPYGTNVLVQNSIIINESGIVDKGNGIGLKEKRSLYVFK